MGRLPAAAVLVTLIAAGSATSALASDRPPAARPHVRSAAGPGLSNWPTYHRTSARLGEALRRVKPPLQETWTADLDGAVYGEPLVVNGLLIAATENDSVYALNPRSGRVKWRTHLGPPESKSDIQDDLGTGCGDIFPLGITGTPAYDAATGSVFVVAETYQAHHTLWALNAMTGQRRWHTSTDVVANRDRRAEQQRSALLVAHGHVFTTYGGVSGDCGNYVGYITSTKSTGNGRTRHYAVPTYAEAGMWSPAGPVEGANGDIYVASGNGAELAGRWDKSDSVTELSPAKLHRRHVFGPSTWKKDNKKDLDLGSSSPIAIPDLHRIVIAGKSGTVYLLKQSLGGLGGEITSIAGCPAFGGAARHGHVIVMPCKDGIRALKVGADSLHWKWRVQGTYSSPVIAGKRVYAATGAISVLSTLVVLSLKTGERITAVPIAHALTHFPSEVIDGRFIYVPTLDGITAIAGS
jgi:outer membrane protein assembly factor BamB